MKDKKAREAIDRLIEEVGASPHLVWPDAEPIRPLLKAPRPTAVVRIRHLEAQLKELYDYLGVERVTTPQETKLIEKEKHNDDRRSAKEAIQGIKAVGFPLVKKGKKQ